MAGRNLVPMTDNESDLGSPTKRWKDIHVTNIDGYVPTSSTTTTPTASSIPIADSGGKIADGWVPDTIARLASPALTGSPTAPTQTASDDSTQIATTAHVKSVVADYVAKTQVATTSATGVVELATAEEADAGNDTTRAITPSVSGSRTTFATTSTDDATSATAAPLMSAGGLAVAKKSWLNTLVLGEGGVEIRSRSASGYEGAAIIASQFGDYVPVTGFLFVTETGTTNFLIASFFKQSIAHVHECTILHSSGLSLGAKNVWGTQVINGASVNANVRMRAIFIKGD